MLTYIRYQRIYADVVSNTSEAKEGLPLDDFKKLLNLVPEVRDRKKSDKDEKEEFDQLHADKNGMIGENEMRNKEQFQKVGNLQEWGKGVIRILKAFDVEGGSDDRNQNKEIA